LANTNTEDCYCLITDEANDCGRSHPFQKKDFLRVDEAVNSLIASHHRTKHN
jgi:hypothetical protein